MKASYPAGNLKTKIFVLSFLALASAPLALAANDGGHGETVTTAIAPLFGDATAASSFALTPGTSPSLTSDTNYKKLMKDCRKFDSPADCAGVTVFGTVNNPTAPESQRAMNRMVILNPAGGRRYENISVGSGNVNYDKSLVNENEIGFINLSYYRGAEGMPFNRCDSEIVVCGDKVVGCPVAQQSVSCSPVVAENSFTNANCTCAAGKILTGCINNVPSCSDAPTPTSKCVGDEIAVGTACMKPWSCNTLEDSEKAQLAGSCPSTSIGISRADKNFYPPVMNCNGTKVCTDTTTCQAGSFKSSETQCTSCAAGSYAPGENMTSCMACPAGTTSVAGSAKCSPCEAGAYAVDGKSCVACPIGTYQPSVGSASCIACQRPNVPGATEVDVTTASNHSTSDASCSYAAKGCVLGYSLSDDKKVCSRDPAIPAPSPSPVGKMLVFAKHSYDDCTAAGGTLVRGPQGESESFCKFPVALDSTKKTRDGKSNMHYLWYGADGQGLPPSSTAPAIPLYDKDNFCPAGWSMYNRWGSWSYKRTDMIKGAGILASADGPFQSLCVDIKWSNDPYCDNNVPQTGSGWVRMTKKEYIKKYWYAPDGVTRLSQYNPATFGYDNKASYLIDLSHIDEWYSADSNPSYAGDNAPVALNFYAESYVPTFQDGAPKLQDAHIMQEANWYILKKPTSQEYYQYEQSMMESPKCRICEGVDLGDYNNSPNCVGCPLPPTNKCFMNINTWRMGAFGEAPTRNTMYCYPAIVEAGCF